MPKPSHNLQKRALACTNNFYILKKTVNSLNKKLVFEEEEEKEEEKERLAFISI